LPISSPPSSATALPTLIHDYNPDLCTVERPIFFHLSLPPAPFEAYDLPSLHELIKDVYLTRNDEELDELKKARRPGRPKAKREIEIEEIKRKENAEYENGFGKLFPFASRLLLWHICYWRTNMLTYLSAVSVLLRAP
jgi:hypothetical protein